MIAKIDVVLKRGLLDAQGKSVKSALESLGFKGVQGVRIGKHIEIELSGRSAAAAKKDLERMCKTLLSNPVVETYRMTVTT